MKAHFMAASLAALFFGSCGVQSTPETANTEKAETTNSKFATLKLENGVNVSHWLSQSESRGEARDKQICKADFDSIAAMGFDFVRLPVDEEHLYDEKMNRDTAGFRLMHNAIKWSLDNGLNIVVDLHVVRSHHFNSENAHPNTLFQDPAEQEKFVNIWKDLQKDLCQYPTDRVAYELMNEPVAPSCEDWNKLIEKTVKAIRETEKERTLIFGSNRWQIVQTFDSLRVPENDKYLVLSFHFYEPSLITHHQAPWTEYSFYNGPVTYPGVPVDSASLAKLNGKEKDLIAAMNGAYSKDTMYAHMKLAIDKAEKYGLHLYCGEFGAYPKFIPKETRLRWYEDICSVFREHNIANCHWCYKGDFPVVNEDRSPNELPAILSRK
ncbi:MAG: glycoside hydrolase family 5 protein [Paludibacteraceae bacterium]|nr:glycoside hydrolase family 5 protein [Paludibacteraceae bacterium]